MPCFLYQAECEFADQRYKTNEYSAPVAYGHRDVMVRGRVDRVTSRDAGLMQTRQGVVPGYNAQAMVSPLAEEGGTAGTLATAVVNEACDTARLTHMVEQAEEVTGVRVLITLAEAGYFAGKHLAELHQSGLHVLMPDLARPTSHSYHKDQFVYDEETGSYDCPPCTKACLHRTQGQPEE